MTESSLTLLHADCEDEDTTPRILDFQKGHPAHVEFDFLKIWRKLRTFHPSDWIGLHFIHVHPKGFGVGMSGTDVDCLTGFVEALSFSPLFSIIEFTDDRLNFKQATYEIQSYQPDKILTLTDSAKPLIPIWAANILWNLATQEYTPLNYKQEENKNGT